MCSLSRCDTLKTWPGEKGSIRGVDVSPPEEPVCKIIALYEKYDIYAWIRNPLCIITIFATQCDKILWQYQTLQQILTCIMSCLILDMLYI